MIVGLPDLRLGSRVPDSLNLLHILEAVDFEMPKSAIVIRNLLIANKTINTRDFR